MMCSSTKVPEIEMKGEKNIVILQRFFLNFFLHKIRNKGAKNVASKIYFFITNRNSKFFE